MAKYQVIVGNVGTVYDGDDGAQALREFKESLDLSKNSEFGRFAGEEVTMMIDDFAALSNDFKGHDCNFCQHEAPNMAYPKHCLKCENKPNGICGLFGV